MVKRFANVNKHGFVVQRHFWSEFRLHSASQSATLAKRLAAPTAPWAKSPWALEHGRSWGTPYKPVVGERSASRPRMTARTRWRVAPPIVRSHHFGSTPTAASKPDGSAAFAANGMSELRCANLVRKIDNSLRRCGLPRL